MKGARRTLLVALVAILGIALAAAVTWRTSQLVRQHIGLASEPLTAGRSLLPPAARTPAAPVRSLPAAPHPRKSTTRTAAEPAPVIRSPAGEASGGTESSSSRPAEESGSEAHAQRGGESSGSGERGGRESSRRRDD